MHVKAQALDPRPVAAAAAFLIALVALGTVYGDSIRSRIVDVVSYVALVDEFMRYGHVRPEDTYLGWSMLDYPPISHWLASCVGKVFGAGIVGVSLISITAIYVSYYVGGRLLVAEGFIAAPVVFAATFMMMRPTRSMVGWEIVGNFFYPQLVAFTFFFLAIGWIALIRPTALQLAGYSIILVPLIFMTQPLAGVHLIATILLFLTTDAAAQWVSTRRLNRQSLAAAAAVLAVTIPTLWLPDVRALLSHASNNGELNFAFPRNALFLPFCLCFIVSLVNFARGTLNWPRKRVDQVIGAVGVAAGCLMLIQLLALIAFGSGSMYAVKKHGFILVTFALINFARLLAQALPTWTAHRREHYVAVLLATFASVGVLRAPKILDVQYIKAAQKFADEFTRTSFFEPGNTSVYLFTSPATSMLISVSSFHNNIDDLYRLQGSMNPKTKYLMVDSRAPIDPSCALTSDGVFSIVKSSCAKTVPLGVKINFGTEGSGAIYCDQDWWVPETWGVWGLERPALVMQLPSADYVITGQVQALLWPSHPISDFDVLVNGRRIATWSFTPENNAGERSAEIPATILDGGESRIEFVATTPIVSPKEAGASSDQRKISIGLSWLEVTKKTN